ncbi:MAG: excinuclease ABC subunit C [Candidatus Kerfeldbacteria bacterium RIFCSPLOWO2_01_FULL_48_11]|uniref:UvrABC system protein C n=1 Tax=Candidatus Kerfeldbacteria bacterium RIFCSPLOWO2_01_FULL_48_11 TaxID=1798543 RepID=A0A1G2B6U2_9BACT|nr:MAG: UvrABC system protein C [Parcubacteria group bacterium GW2011_GWC2_49_9]OGY83970.1 MAG: excinuclease ABC subunit C [Candidatus Kerfeldbacteria bacterium RIFCSPLOWO2_01_FULL_48_11]HCJ52717.1 excinuclease ABC subunit C [Candidatus Kerfeldbacteria bacterium]
MPSPDITHLPAKPGVYLYKNATGKTLYIGKARILINRVRSYFQKRASLSVSKQRMVREIVQIETIVTSTENEALLLEATLIKRHQPPYNIDLKDDKRFLYIKITVNEPFPRVFATRTILREGAKYFGPYTSAGYVRYTLRTLKRLFPHRNFEKPPSTNNLARLTERYPELFGPQDERAYADNIEYIIAFLKGKFSDITDVLEKRMRRAAESEHFETAATYRDNLEGMKRMLERQQVISPNPETYDLLGLARKNDYAVISVLYVREGKLIGKQDFALTNTSGETDRTVVSSFLEQYYPTSPEHVKTVYLPISLPNLTHLSSLMSINLHPAQRGTKRRLIKMAEENAREYLARTESEREKSAEASAKALGKLAEVLKLRRPPERIECYDISNIQGTHPVGSMVVFERGEPAKKEYRKFKIKTVSGSNDPAMMAEVLDRRFSGTKHPGWKSPNLIILDGGKGQLSVVTKRLGTRIAEIAIVALAKREEELFLPGKSTALRLSVGTPAYHLVQRIRDEAHRFAIGYYRKRHVQSVIASTLDSLPGVGPKIRSKLLKAFGSLEGIRSAGESELASVIGAAKAKKVKQLI